jgi:hypothetical protein
VENGFTEVSSGGIGAAVHDGTGAAEERQRGADDADALDFLEGLGWRRER